MTRLGAAIRQIRETRGESETEFALRIGAFPDSVAQFEAGTLVPTAGMLATIEVTAANDADRVLLATAAGRRTTGGRRS